VFDSESDDLAYAATKIHIMVWTDDGKSYHDTGDYGQMTEWLSEPDVLWVCHNAVKHDMVLFNRLLGLDLTYRQFWDTLALSWALFPDRPKHGLGALAKEYGTEKPDVEDWENVTYEQMLHRCKSDVETNWVEWIKQKKRLEELYEGK
jgi:DNA polymerase III alpha subunit (gram-positive type)